MRFAPITPARIAFGDDGTPHAPDFGDVYHARVGALAQARHVFLGGNALPQRWQRRARFVVLETGFGLGHNFLATWAAWRDDDARCERLWFVSIDKHPPARADLRRAHAASPLPALSRELVAAWPPLTPDLHTLAFDGARVMLRLAFGDVAAWLPQLVVEADAFFLDGFAPDRNPAMWDRRVLRALAGRAAPGATAATWSAAREVRDALASAGFAVERAPGFAGKREMTVARYAPAFVPRRSRTPAREAPGEAVVVGAGLAGAAAADALAAAGWQVTVFDRHPSPAAETSGNAGGLFHGNVAADDTPHARVLRAAALEAARVYAPWLRDGVVTGAAAGLLQRAGALTAAAMRERLERQGLPPAYAQVLDGAAASDLAGVALHGPWWWLPGGGWLAPASLVARWLAHPRIAWRGGAAVQALRRDRDRWQVLDAGGRVLATTATVVLANAADALRLLDDAAWPLRSSRGQVTLLPRHAPSLRRPAVPLAGDGYVLPLPDGRTLCGATRAADDPDATPRAADHAYNLRRLQRLVGAAPALDPAALDGRVGWRLAAPDRLPVIGAVPAPGARATRVRDVARADGLFVCTAFGSRGITWAPLAGALIASWATGDPFPLEARLVDALDPARFAVAR
ncbi:bifunctional tRNA (5-methylaminomethyl-2-thiouridine)(34)-methyltransferase MnmD/FAD-dependent 5-carboxymethylaminomethyl-2-thiouridine(34) oxidoreductase MnmC [Azohydromonas sp.]|mgnify:CR=1 FL=1|uniref:bifunctional tRNA (5-methylaminomethyl-2-thiouridine)(34)-methyltransferase MnmD/FAD-dependent 5-carboxymethylaminomethyl-2-thiouridine(34) oxidoreductase MnmC n=1 Tax=Azohydromonas sp. TaxID=1872666 RepID=UPI002C718E48|nr:bifunctional tRNA (5-methylaminomethyl-2-thiouridine)(34)-methyltransferase MnmD/FAD-dependent 5-carboxymethylaminomethyl-2-thiouridine(34) oxidoreductase MnmC [Azohydromonas sp.]HMM86976.1 bifunctional tRNA (5-methylaminomethyl-2-thiouridine)(34)-methyltransferase MnmD/FAD-dependent 5-carboxymethylaminomethyl-2-thiouridine(34) oxidoreductase MnmC [Azohydromonas sp.]